MTTPTWTWTPPTRRQAHERSRQLRVGLSSRMLQIATEIAAGLTGQYEAVGQWWQETAVSAPTVQWEPGDDPWNATQYTCDVPATGSGPLDGVTLSVKDAVRVAGVPLAYGSRLVEGHMARTSATVVDRALAAGATITHTGRSDDLGLAITGDQNYNGPVLNPWHPEHTPWGSSAGAAALVAVGETTAAILVDQAGSGRVPAAGCGLAALMPTRGMLPMTGALGFTAVQDRICVASRSTETVAQLASALSGGDSYDLKCGPPDTPPQDWATDLTGDVAGMRIGLIAESLTPELTDPDVADAVQAQADALVKLGAELVEVSVPRYADASALALVLTLQRGVPDLLTSGLGSDTSVLAGDPLLAHHFTDLRCRGESPDCGCGYPELLARTVQLSAAAAGWSGGQATGVWLAAAMDLIPRLTAQFTDHFTGPSQVDVLLCPTAPSTPPEVPGPDMSELDELARAIGPGITHACAHNLTGLPAGQAPAGLVDGLPVGIQVVAPALREDQVLRVLAALEPAGGYPAPPAP